jgi:nitrate/TMAO reductase-like tetraheme cytochrome c subunit
MDTNKEAAGSGPPAGDPGRRRGWFRNPISYLGAAVAVVAFINIVFLFLIDALSSRPSPYIGIFAYMIMPGFLVLGLLLILAGMLRERSRRRRQLVDPGPRFPRIDLNNPEQRSKLAFGLAFLVVFILLTALGSYRAYQFTDSVQFCGQLCHSVMDPEYQAYRLSPHARVACVDCHVGAGASWYVRSKLSGARQVYAAAFNTFPRPIPTPVANLRPAQETCEQCHWPRRFVGDQLKTITHYAADEKNTPRQVRLVIKTGGGDPSTGMATGIHWHMNIGNEVQFAVTDPKQQKIDWVQVRNRQSGAVTVYKAQDTDKSDAQLAAAPRRTMDCIACHNRPTHIYVPPDRSVDQSLLAGRLDAAMPFMKAQAVAALVGDYGTTEKAMQGIARSLRDFYARQPQVPAAKVEAAIQEVQRIYRSSIFPEMKVDWRTHPDNIGHYYFPGCFRCHDGQHVSPAGKVLTQDCNVCHTVLNQESGQAKTALKGVAFQHPGGELPEGVKCADCHTGATGP